MEEQSFLLPPPTPPAIRVAMAKAARREEIGLPVIDFSSGSIGKLLFKLNLFTKLDIEVNKELSRELQLIAEAVKQGILEAYYPSPKGLAYFPTGGTEWVKKWVIEYFKEMHGVPLVEKDFDKVIATAGGQQAMMAAIRSIKPRTKVFIPQWEYEPIPAIVKDRGCEVIRIKANDDLSINKEDLKEKVVVNSVFYISMPNNPTGYTSTQDFEAVLRNAKEKNCGVIWDAPYIFTILRLSSNKAEFDKEFLQSRIEEFKKIVKKYYEDMCILSSISKTCLMAGIRFGFATASARWINLMEAIIGRENLSSPTPGFIMGTYALQMFLKNPIMHEWTCKILAERLTLLIEEGLPLILPKNGEFGALYVLLNTRGLDGAKFAEELIEKHGIVTVPGNPFYGESIDAVRLSLVATPWVEGDEEWRKNVKALKKALS
ncbi:MAG: pyridoxal phosphate-dependent aminotransferase [Candidatus Bathyarchaeia archaeon]